MTEEEDPESSELGASEPLARGPVVLPLSSKCLCTEQMFLLHPSPQLSENGTCTSRNKNEAEREEPEMRQCRNIHLRRRGIIPSLEAPPLRRVTAVTAGSLALFSGGVGLTPNRDSANLTAVSSAHRLVCRTGMNTHETGGFELHSLLYALTYHTAIAR